MLNNSLFEILIIINNNKFPYINDLVLLKYSCKYLVTTALQGKLALPVILWLKVAGATYFKIGNCDSGPTECSTTA